MKTAATIDDVHYEDPHALLATSLRLRADRLAGEDMVSTDEAAQLAGTGRVTIHRWITEGRAIGLSQAKRGFRMPRWQFAPAMWSVIPKVSSALRVKEGQSDAGRHAR